MTAYPGEHPIGAMLRNIVQLERTSRFADSPQITLGEMIRHLEACPLTYEDHRGKSEPKHVWFDFAGTYPSELQSWRGSYNELAITFDYDGRITSKLYRERHPETYMTAERFLTMLREAVGATYEGYKGGDYTMAGGTPVWVANYGDSGNTGVAGVRDTGSSIVIETGWCEY